MATKFGVELKKPDGAPGTDRKGPSKTPGGAVRSDFKTKPVSDLKAMFTKIDKEAGNTAETKQVSMATAVDQKSTTSLSQTTRKTEYKNTSPRSNLSATTKPKLSKESSSGGYGNSKGVGLTQEDRDAFASLKCQLTTGSVDLKDLDSNAAPAMAVAKTYSGGNAYKATVDAKKVQTAGEDGDGAAVNKTNVAALLSFGLTKLRTRPGSGKLDDNGGVGESGSVTKGANNNTVARSESPKFGLTKPRELKKDKYIPGAATGWKRGSVDDDSASNGIATSQGSTAKFSDSSVGKIRTEVKTEKETTVKGFRSVSPVNFRRNSSDDSSGSLNMSPRGFKPNPEYSMSSKTEAEQTDTKMDINKNIRKFQPAKSDTNVFKAKHDNLTQGNKGDTKKSDIVNTKGDSPMKAKLSKVDSKPKISAVEQLAIDKDRIRTKRNSGSFSSDSEKGKRSPKPKTEFKWMDKGRISLEEFKQQTKTISESPARHQRVKSAEGQLSHRPLSRASSSGSNSSLSRSDASSIQSRITRFASPDSESNTRLRADTNPESAAHLDAPAGRRRDFAVSKKMPLDRFKDIKKGFEVTQGIQSRTVNSQPDKKHQIKMEKKFLERKQSFEGGEVFRKKSYERKELISPRDRGKVSVLQTVKALTELDAKAKAQPAIIRRTQSLPSDSFEEEYDSSVDYYDDAVTEEYYQEIQGMRIGDDVSNEGDISSEADLIYEEIPANMALEDLSNTKKDFKDRRTMAIRKRRKASGEETAKPVDIQTGTDGDIDSDSDSSNSGIYEYVDNDIHETPKKNVSESDSAPEVPAPRAQTKKKKKKEAKAGKEEKEKKGLRTKIKQLYKGKSADNVETASGLSTSQSAGVLSKLKNLKKTKNSNSGTNLETLNTGSINEDNPVCASSGTDTDVDIDPAFLRPDDMAGSAPEPPPLPPRHSELLRVSSGGELSTKLNNDKDQTINRLSATTINSSSNSSNADYLNNRAISGNYENHTPGRKSPPLPPRNRISNNLDLNVVIPVNPGGEIKKCSWAPNKDSYLHMQKIHNKATSPDIPYMDDSPSPKVNPAPDAPPLPSRPVPIGKRDRNSNSSTNSSYVDVDKTPPVPRRPTSKPPLGPTDSYVDVGDAPMPDSEYSLADEIRTGPYGRKELEKRPVSSAYIQPHDLTTVPSPRNMQAPFEDMLKFQGNDGLYMDLSDDQVYGTAGRFKSQFETESLYQFYNKDKIHRASKRKAIYSSFDESDEDDDSSLDKESIYEDLSEYSSGRGSLDMEKRVEEEESKDKKISTLEMFGRKGTVLRCLWAEMPEVKSSGVLDTITPHERKLQESMFEIITSEATYLKSLNVLMDVFLCSEEFGSDMSNKCVLTRNERHVIFSNIGAIRDASERFLAGLEERWQKNCVLSDICDIIGEHSEKNFECYIHYCSNQAFQDKAVTDLRKKQEFSEALKRLEASPECQGLPMISFLLLPMQRVTRLPLLVDAICHRLDPIKDKSRHKSVSNAFNALSKVVKKCNDGAKKMQQTEQMYHIAKQIEFTSAKEIPQIPLISASRYLVKQGEVTRITNDTGTRLPFGKAKAGKQPLHIYLFNDILLITKKKSDKYIVVDYGQRNTLHVEVIDNIEKNTRVLPLGVPSGCKYLFLLVMLENYEKKQVEMVFSCNTTSDRARWVDAVTPVKVTDDQRIYEEWDCPQVQCVKKYIAKEPDELSLEESDVVNVFKKLDDGMFEGERLRDGERGWFPKDHTVEIVNSHVRARNLRMKYRLMAAADYYVKS